MKDTWNTKTANRAWSSQSNSPIQSDSQSKSGSGSETGSDSKFSDSLKCPKFDENKNSNFGESSKFEESSASNLGGLAKTATFASLNSVGSFPANSSLDSIWSNNNSSSNLLRSNPWSDNYLPPANEKAQNYDNSTGLDGTWGGLTFSVNQKPGQGGSLGGFSDRDSLSPPSDQCEKKECLEGQLASWLPKSLADDIDSESSPRLSVFRSIFSSEK